jgi:hypothetical protein
VNLDVTVGLQAGEQDEVLGHVHDADRLTHLEDEELASNCAARAGDESG